MMRFNLMQISSADGRVLVCTSCGRNRGKCKDENWCTNQQIEYKKKVESGGYREIIGTDFLGKIVRKLVKKNNNNENN